MKVNNIASAIAACGLLSLATTAADASVYLLDNQASGYISEGGNFTGIRPNTNYLVGLCNASNCQSAPGEYRNYFYFSIPTLDGAITSAELVIPTRNVTLDQSRTVSYQVTSLGIDSASLGSANFADLGTGTYYGNREYSIDDAQITHHIPLNADAIAALGAGGFSFGLSGRLSSPTDFGINAPDQLLFGRTQRQVSQLLITTVPVPAAWSMMLIGFSGLGFLRRRGVKNSLNAG